MITQTFLQPGNKTTQNQALLYCKFLTMARNVLQFCFSNNTFNFLVQNLQLQWNSLQAINSRINILPKGFYSVFNIIWTACFINVYLYCLSLTVRYIKFSREVVLCNKIFYFTWNAPGVYTVTCLQATSPQWNCCDTFSALVGPMTNRDRSFRNCKKLISLLQPLYQQFLVRVIQTVFLKSNKTFLRMHATCSYIKSTNQYLTYIYKPQPNVTNPCYGPQEIKLKLKVLSR